MESLEQKLKVDEGLAPKRYYNQKEKHPMEKLKENSIFQSEKIKLGNYSKIFGFHLPMKIVYERNALAQSRRLPGLKSSFLGLDIHMNNFNKIDFEDFLGTEDPMIKEKTAHSEFLKGF